MAYHKQIVWSIIVVTAWLSLVTSVWLAAFNLSNPWLAVYWGITFIITVMFGVDQK